MVIIDDDKTSCGRDADNTYTCIVDVQGEEQIHKIHVCYKHKRHFEERNL